MQNGVLTRRAPLERLLAALNDIDRLVLLGDVVELSRDAPPTRWASPSPCSRRSARGSEASARSSSSRKPRPPAGRPVGPRAGVSLAPDAVVPVDATPALARVTSWLSPARVRVHYPGVWLSERVNNARQIFDCQRSDFFQLLERRRKSSSRCDIGKITFGFSRSPLAGRLMVGLGRLELPTSPLSGVRSSHLSYRPLDQGPLSAAQTLVELVGIEPATS